MKLKSAPEFGIQYDTFEGVHFKMLDGAEPVNCLVTIKVLQDLAASDGRDTSNIPTLFAIYQSAIEEAADHLYVAGHSQPTITNKNWKGERRLSPVEAGSS
jgi:hypothetical protein